jgi:hypothetical protein
MTCAYALSHLSDQALLAELAVLVAADRRTTSALLAHIAEVDARTLYLPAACPSMHSYCVRVLHLAEDAAFKRIRAARTARRFPQIFAAVADGRLHLSGVVLLAPHLTDDNADELIAAASHKPKAEIELLLAQRRPRPDVPTRIEPAPAQPLPLVAPGPVDVTPSPARVTPLAPQRFALQVTISQATQEKLMRAQALLRHQVPSGAIDQVLDRALDALLASLERRKLGATTRPRRQRRAIGTDPRYVPREVRRAVHARDGEQCSFFSEEGERCPERGFLELDHRTPVARGGRPTVENLRLLCKFHNGYEAERILGSAFVRSRIRAKTKPCTAPAETAEVPGASVGADGTPSVEAEALLGLRGLGFSHDEAVGALARIAHLPATSLEQRLRLALAELHGSRTPRCAEAPPRWRHGRLDACAPAAPAVVIPDDELSRLQPIMTTPAGY